MCTVVILRRPDHDWPLLIGANRDEMRNRPSQPPMRHWADRPHVVAGLDEEAGGTWLGINDDGVVACVLNRFGTLGSHPDFRSRGELPLEALEHAEAEIAAEAFVDLNPEAYRPFNMVIADYKTAWWIKNDGMTIQTVEIEDGLSMLSAHDLNDKEKSDRLQLHLPRFRSAPAPDPNSDDWMSWTALLSSRKSIGDARSAMQIETDFGFETVSSSLLAIPKPWEKERKPIWKFSPGKPSDTPFDDVQI
ncbi:NRDE family protein [Terasakiella sp. SH-1]|uniref:NRDE family protein n=1 Tax=Terasakiella sp. SH-1 TaxID=2560057 RepID=UPI0010742B62|nr:NRDE family protein [Terasakiella sp. SH-1]